MAKIDNSTGWISGETTLEEVELNPLKVAIENGKKENNIAPSAYEIWKSFFDATSLHGIRYVFWRRPLWARMGWLIILLAFTAYFLFTAHGSIKKFASFPINTVITQKYEDKLDFPAVSICPLNLVSKKKMFTLDDDPYFVKYGLNDSFCSATASVRGRMPCGAAMMCCCVSFYLFDGAQIVPNCTSEYVEDLITAQFISGSYYDSTRFYQNYGQGIDEMLGPGMCMFDADVENPCGPSNFTTTVTDWGTCYTFNAGPDDIIKAQLHGPAGGLNILLDTQIEDQTIGRLSEGFSVIIHPQGDFFTPWDGINVSPGTQATINLHQQRIINLEEPYETKCQNKKLKVAQTYTKGACQYECIVEAIIKSCKCRSGEYAAASSLRTCARIDSQCIYTVTSNLEPSKCDCPVPCHETRYTTEVHYSQFPDAGSAAVITQNNVPFEYMRKNFVFLQIGYKALSYELHEQKVAFGTEALLGEIGGNMGLFLGCSLMTIFEFADLLIALIFVRKFNKEYQM